MSALAEALVAAQRSAVSALGKAYVAHTISDVEVRAKLALVGLPDQVDREQWLAALDVLREHGAPAPAEPQASPETVKASDKQKQLIADLCKRKNVEAPDLPGLTKAQASEVIDSLDNGSYDATKWTVPF